MKKLTLKKNDTFFKILQNTLKNTINIIYINHYLTSVAEKNESMFRD